MSTDKEYKLPDVFIPVYSKYMKPYGGCRFVDPGVFPALCDLLDLLANQRSPAGFDQSAIDGVIFLRDRDRHHFGPQHPGPTTFFVPSVNIM